MRDFSIQTSYFYQIRFMKPYMIPLSTCMSDPKWFHQNQGKNFHYKDKNGVYNGLRAEPFVPTINGNEHECKGPKECSLKPIECGFYTNYYNQLNSLDFNSIMERFERLGYFIKEKEGFIEIPTMILIVHEVPSNPCSERIVIQKWFKDNGIIIKEFKKDKS